MSTELFSGKIGSRSVEVALESEAICWTGEPVPWPLQTLGLVGVQGKDLIIKSRQPGADIEKSLTVECSDTEEAHRAAALLTLFAGLESCPAMYGFDWLAVREGQIPRVDQAMAELHELLAIPAPGDPSLNVAFRLELWTTKFCFEEEVDQSSPGWAMEGRPGPYTEAEARLKGDLIPVQAGIPLLLSWVQAATSKDEEVLRIMHVGRFHGPVNGGNGIVARTQPMADTLREGETIMGYSRAQIVRVADECPLCNGSWTPEGQYRPGTGSSLPPQPPQPARKTGVYTHSGERFLLGYTDDFFGIWDRERLEAPSERYSRDDDGWRAVWERYTAIEANWIRLRTGQRSP